MSDMYSEVTRFAPSTESIEGFKQIRDYVEKRQVIDPRFKGITFIGSRVHGLEKNGSDFDVNVFFDASDFQISGDQDVQTQNRLTESRNQYMRSLRNDVVQMMKQSNLPVDEQIGKTISLIGSPINMRGFKSELVRKYKNAALNSGEFEGDDHGSEAFAIAARFFLGVGKRLMDDRREILRFIENDPDGDFLLKGLMQHVQFHERTAKTKKRPGLIPYSLFPATIQEAKKYFLSSTD